MRFLCVSDIHGHHDRLCAVIDAASGLGFDQMIACGDLCFPGPEPLQVWKTLVEHRAVCVQGLTDRAVALVDPAKVTATSEQERARLHRLAEVHRELGDIIVARLGRLEPMVRLPVESGQTVLVVHCSPADPSEPFSHDLTDEEMLALLAGEPGDIVICGGSHVPFSRTVMDVHFINVGSVGEPPGGTHATAAIVETSQVGLRVQDIEVPL